MPDDSEKQARVKAFFDSLNSMAIPDSFNWVSQVFEDIHVDRTPNKTALVYEDLTTPDPKRYQLVKAYVILSPGETGSRELAGGEPKGLKNPTSEMYFYWDFPELSSKNK